MDTDEEEFCFPIGLGSALDLFRERDEVMDLIHSLPEIYQNVSKVENAYETYQKIIDRYQEQPHLLDRHLEEMIEVCLNIARSSSAPSTQSLKHLSLKFLKQLFKVRGPKEVVKRMPHEVADLAPVLIYLENENLDDPKSWESGYVYVMWLSILVINPFHLKLLDGASDGDLQLSIAQRLMNVCKKCLILNNNIGQAAPTLISKFLTRPDMLDIYMESFISWACENLTDTSTFGTRFGCFSALASIFKHAKRQEIINYGKKVLDTVLKSNFASSDTLLRKGGMKLIQRIGMMFMKTHIAPWRYQRGSRSLLLNLKASDPTGALAKAKEIARPKNDITDYEELTLYSGDIESILDQLLTGLKDKDTVVRWSAAKGIGRVTNRLPKEYGDEVVESLLEIFNGRELSGAWHGGCLALAELARRGLLLPERVQSVIPVIKKALLYDEIRGNFSVGSHVRDAACYVLWAFARAFEPSIIEPFAQEISTALIITMLFDREVNCRRAASAAFQENVGRLGNFPFGIDIVTVADYFAIGIRSVAYTNVSVEIAKYSKEYTHAMVDHLMTIKFNHFDPDVRDITAQALSKLTHCDPKYVRQQAMNLLLPRTTEVDLATSHGAILSLSMILVQLQELGELELTSSNRLDIRNIVWSILQRQFKASIRGQELLRQVLAFYIKSCALARLPVHDDTEIIEIWHGFLEENLSFQDSKVRMRAAEALPSFFEEYYYKSPVNRKKIGYSISVFSKNLKSRVLVTRMGYAVALGKMSLRLLKGAFEAVIETLSKCALIVHEWDTPWAECRREAILSLSSIIGQGIVPTEENEDWSTGIPVEKLDYKGLFKTFVAGLEDYTTDKRGDIGSWVRQASMTALELLMLRLTECESKGGLDLLDEEIITNVLRAISKQCVEQIDNVRVHGGLIFSRLLHFGSPPIRRLPRRDELTEVFPQTLCKSMNWRSSAETFPRFASLLVFPEYTYSILSGFAVSGGSLSDTVLKGANGALTNYLQDAGENGESAELQRIGNILIQIFKDHSKVERVTIPLMKFLTQLLQSGLFTPLLCDESNKFGEELIDCVKDELLRSSRVDKIVVGIELLCETMQGSPNIVRLALKRLVVYMGHAYPRVRNLTANKVYESLLTYGDTLDCPNINTGISILSETSWDRELSQVKIKRGEFCRAMEIPEPQPIKKTLICN